MSRWLIRIGVFFLVVGMLLLSPLTDLMPADAGFTTRPADPSHVRIVPTEDGDNGGMALAVLGAALLGAGLLARRRGR